ncbi:response regulator transcription factor [Bacillus sp. 2205SS5-2]|uniref:response regulator transcription factor n=1 Tax=Bacillus sp. 2205SS5-2 TaxID=3109031 RepID=UPI00300447E0
MNILIVEDEKNLSRFLELELKHEGYDVKVVADGREAITVAIVEEWDLILLDVMLPSLNGIEVCRRVRKSKSTPIIMITARDGVMDRVSGLDSGADDYIVKPFAIEELLARIRAVDRRTASRLGLSTKLTVKDLSLEKEARILIRRNKEIDLTKREFELLLTFMENINIVLTREQLLDKVWGFDSEVETNVVDVYVRYVRNKLQHENNEHYIETVRGIGYVMRT